MAVWPASAHAQRVQVDVRVSEDIGRELRNALREVTTSVGDALREVSRDLGRDLGRDIAPSLRSLPRMGHLSAWDGGWDDAQDRNFRARVEDRQTRVLALGASGTLTIENLSGNITIGVGSRSEATIELLRESRGRTETDARVGLDRVKVITSATGTRGSVKTDYPNERQSSYSVSVTMNITVPSGTRVIVNSVSGDVKATNVKGELSVNTISGDITISNVGSVSEAKTVSGDVTITSATGDVALDAGSISGDVQLQQVKARRITAGTVSGSVSARDVTCDSATLSAMSGDAWFSGSVARDGRYEITSHSGDVHFMPAGGAGFSVTASSFGGDISTSLALQSDGRTRRRSLSGRIGDGSATVKLQTFNGDIVIGAPK